MPFCNALTRNHSMQHSALDSNRCVKDSCARHEVGRGLASPARSSAKRTAIVGGTAVQALRGYPLSTTGQGDCINGRKAECNGLVQESRLPHSGKFLRLRRPPLSRHSRSVLRYLPVRGLRQRSGFDARPSSAASEPPSAYVRAGLYPVASDCDGCRVTFGNQSGDQKPSIQSAARMRRP